MASLRLEHIYKVYPGGTKAVSDVVIDVKDGEFVVLVGPSGCGKSTTLRMIAGLEQITAGELYIGDNIVNDMEPKDRDIAMVFQNYALYPQMTVYDNMAFGLRLRHVPNDIIQQKVMWAADILGLREMLDRKPKAMSGGQRQRVALGRAILRDPKVMLLDEPLSNLDAKLRTSMRTEIAKLHQRLKATFVYVTHDQTEAMTLGDRVVVMKNGTVQQIDTPKNLYNYPSNKFVAGFIGTPQMNFFDGTLTKKGSKVLINLDKAEQPLQAKFADFVKVNPTYLDGKKPVTMGIRCEHLHLVGDEKTEEAFPVKVSRFEELGSDALVYGDIDVGNKDVVASLDSTIIIKVAALPKSLKIGDIVNVALDMDYTYFFDKKTEESIVPRIPLTNIFDAEIKDGKLAFLGASFALPAALRKVANVKGTLIVPNDAFDLDDGPVKATVVKTETIGKTKLVHLLAKGHTFFAATSKAYTAGKILDVGVDFSRISFKDAKDKEVIKSLGQFDDFTASFYNFKTVTHQDNDTTFQQAKEDRQKAIADDYDARIKAVRTEFETVKAATTPKDFKEVLAKSSGLKDAAYKALVQKRSVEGRKALIGERQKKKTEIARLRKDKNERISALKAHYKEALKRVKAENAKTFAEHKAQEVKDYKGFLATNKDREATKRRRDEYHMYMGTFADQKQNALEYAVKSEDLIYDGEVGKIRANYKREVKAIRNKYQDKVTVYKRTRDPVTFLEDLYGEKVKALEKEKRAAVNKAGMVFFFGIDKSFFLSPPLISGKLIQGLGTSVFGKQYLIEVPHDAYVKAAKGIQAKIEEIVDYGADKFARCSYKDPHGGTRNVYIQLATLPEIGSTFSLAFALEKCRITETGMGIRLY